MVQLVEEQASAHNRRFVVRLGDGAAVEAVLYRDDSLCVSCQVGCAVGCPFCASGADGLDRALSLEEMTGQVEGVEAHIAASGGVVRRVTVSGVGEPLHNRAVPALLDWCRVRRTPASLTTSGGPIDRLREMMHALHNGLTVSVHAGTEETRKRAVPNGPALEPLFEAIAHELPSLTRTRQRKLALAYLVIDGLNDDDREIDAFVHRARPLGVTTHLYAYNPVPTSAHRSVPRARYEAIYQRMTDAGLRVRMSSQARLDDNGGCGTLVALRRASRRAFGPEATSFDIP